MKLTANQEKILNVIIRGNPDGTFVDLDQVLDRLATDYAWETTKQSLQFSIRALVRRGLIQKHPREKRRGRSRVILSMTELGWKVMRGTESMVQTPRLSGAGA